MPIPKAPLGEEFGYDFQYLLLLTEGERVAVFLDSYLYEPAFPPVLEDETVYLSAEDLRRIYAPYLQVELDAGPVRLAYRKPREERREAALEPEEVRVVQGITYLPAVSVLSRYLEKPSWEGAGTAVVAVDGSRPVQEVFPTSMSFRPYWNRLHGKVLGEQNYSLWMEEADRVIPYRVYVPCSYRPEVPQKTLVCFHGGDANADYVFRHTDNAICRYAERYGFLLLALTSYRKYTFFGASKVPTGMDAANPADPNPCGLTEDEQAWCQVAEDSVLRQLQDAGKRYNLDASHLYAMGNSGGCLGIFQQVKILPAGFFRAVVCSGGMPTVSFLDTELLRSKGTCFLLLMSTEDVFDGQYTLQVGYPHLRDGGVPVAFCPVGGGSHLLGWTLALDEIFQFFQKHS